MNAYVRLRREIGTPWLDTRWYTPRRRSSVAWTKMAGLNWLKGFLIAVSIFEVASAVTQITFLHWNDLHARVEPADDSGGTCADLISSNNASKCFGGYARLGTFFKQVYFYLKRICQVGPTRSHFSAFIHIKGGFWGERNERTRRTRMFL